MLNMIDENAEKPKEKPKARMKTELKDGEYTTYVYLPDSLRWLRIYYMDKFGEIRRPVLLCSHATELNKIGFCIDTQGRISARAY